MTFGRRRSPCCLSSCFPRGFRNFNKKVGVIVEMVNISSCLNYVELLFTNNRNSFRRDSSNLSANPTQSPHICFIRVQFHYPVKTDTHRCKVHIQLMEKIIKCGVCQVQMCPAPCFLRYHTLQEYLFDDPDRNNSAKSCYLI